MHATAVCHRKLVPNPAPMAADDVCLWRIPLQPSCCRGSANRQSRRCAQGAPIGLGTEQNPPAFAAVATLKAARTRSRAASQPLYNPEVELEADHEGADEMRTIGLSQ